MAEAAKPRGAGAPPVADRVITEVEYPELYRAWVRGASINVLGKKFGCSRQNVAHHLSRIRSAMRMNMLRDRNEVLTELAAVRWAAWESFEKSQTPVKFDEVQKQIAAAKDTSPEVAATVIKQVTKLVSKHGGEPTWLHVVIAAIEQEAKLTGIYEASKIEATMRRPQIDELRVAGSSVEEVETFVAKRLATLLAQKREALIGGTN